MLVLVDAFTFNEKSFICASVKILLHISNGNWKNQKITMQEYIAAFTTFFIPRTFKYFR